MENERSFSITGVIVKIILVIAFIFLLIWLFPAPNLKPVYDRIFADNVETMTDAAKSYYTVERLPKDLNGTVKLTLNDMLSMKLLLPIADSDNKLCDGNASYVEITKTATEYVIKTNLSCPNKTDYVIEHMGCYNLCSNECTIAQQEAAKEANKVIKVVKPTPIDTKAYLYKYQKTTYNTTYKWTDWSADIAYTSSDNIKFGCTDDKCIEKSKTTTVKTGTKTIYKTDASGNKIALYQQVYDNVLTSYEVKACTGYNYVIYQNVGTYSYVSNTTWVDQGVSSFTYVPTDTATTKYVYVGAGFDADCVAECSSHVMLFRVYKSVKTYVSGSTTGDSFINITCASYETKTVPVMGYRKVFIGYQVDRVENVYKTVNYYHYKTRIATTTSSTDTQYRKYYDKALINNGYKLVSKTIIK